MLFYLRAGWNSSENCCQHFLIKIFNLIGVVEKMKATKILKLIFRGYASWF